MSHLDNQQGYQTGCAATARRYNAVLADSNTTIAEWREHAAELQRRLQAAEARADELAKKKLFSDAHFEGQTALMQTLKSALAVVAPNHPLLQDQGRRKHIQLKAMVDYLAQHGYHYVPKTDVVRKVGP